MRTTSDVAGVLDLLPARLAEANDDTHQARAAARGRAAPPRAQARRGRRARRPRARVPARAARSADREPAAVAREGDRRLHDAAASRTLEAIEALGDDPREAARLRLAYADLVADRLDDPAQAADAYAQVAARRARQPPRGPGVRRARQRSSAAGTTSPTRSSATPASARRSTTSCSSILETAARKAGAYDAARRRADRRARQAQAAGRRRRAVPPSPRDAASRSPQRSHGRDRGAAQGTRARRRARTRGSPSSSRSRSEQGTSPALLDALRRLADADGRDLDALVGAADVASQARRSRASARRSCRPCSVARPPRGVAPRRSARRARSMPSRSGRSTASSICIAPVAAPAPPSTRWSRRRACRSIRTRAATCACAPRSSRRVELGDNAAAIDMYRSVLASTPNDLEVIERLAHLLGARGPRPRAAHAAPDPARPRDRPRASKLDAPPRAREARRHRRGARRPPRCAQGEPRRSPRSRGVDRRGRRAARRARASTARSPTCSRSRRSASRPASETARAAKLWARYAHGRRERHQGSRARDRRPPPRRRAGSRRSDSLRALARLNLERSQPAQAVPWLESLLGTVPAAERLLVVSSAREGAPVGEPARPRDRRDRDATSTTRSRRSSCALLLADLYRKAELWEPLARHLTRSLPLLKDDKLAREFAREAVAASISSKLGSPAKAIPALETALALDPTDKDLRTALAIGQRVAGKLAEARAAAHRADHRLRSPPLARARRAARRARSRRPGRGQDSTRR